MEIDLNMDVTQFDTTDGDAQQEEAETLLSDGVDATYFVSGLNLSSASPITEISTSNHLLLDLNTEPCLEDDTNVEKHMSQEINSNPGITFLLYSSCIWLILSYIY